MRGCDFDGIYQFASCIIWPVRLGELYTNISNGVISTVAQGTTAIIAFGLI